MVVATGNKSEMAVGYATLYGDMAGGYAVLKDVFKTLVYRLAEWRNREGRRHPAVHHRRSRRRPSSAPTRRTATPCPTTTCSTRSSRATSSSTTPWIRSSPTASTLDVVRRSPMVDRNEYKRRQAAPGVRITRKAFGKDRRLPITNRFRGERSIGPILIDGEDVAPEAAAISVLDIGLQRGYGCFESVRSYGGRPFRFDAHLDRLEASARKLFIDLPDRPTLQTWVHDRAAQAGDCVVRVLVTGGTSLTKPGTESRILVIAEPIPLVPFSLRVLPLPAPWHSDRTDWTLTGAKTLSYAPNVAATLAARAEGYNDALLIGADEIVLEGPTYCIGWVRDGVIETPSLDVGILASITRSAVIEVAHRLELQVTQRAYRLGRLMEADEAFVMSTVKQILPVIAVGQQELPAGPITRRLVEGFASLVAAETGG